jgi:hypothetical protein
VMWKRTIELRVVVAGSRAGGAPDPGLFKTSCSGSHLDLL